MQGFCNFAVLVDEKSKVPECVKRDPHVFDLVLFLHPKKCLTCGGEKFALLLVLEMVPLTFFLVVFLTSNGIFRTKISFWHFCNIL
jgi:hypothetical protein